VQLAGDGTHLRVQQPLHESVYVFVRGTNRGTIGQPLRHPVETFE